MRESGEVLKCESRVAEIIKIDILTKLRLINVNDYEVLELIGYDKSGNSFTSLEGLGFQWKIDQSSNLASFESFRDAAISTSEERIRLEYSGVQSDMVVMKGQKPGEVAVSAKPRTKFYQVRGA